MRLVVQICCLNEERTLPETLGALPRELEGFDSVRWLVVDDGSSDRTAAVAAEHGADRVVRLNHNRGLARAFVAGLEAALAMGADVIVHTDADNQYEAGDIAALVAPILAGRADLVVGARPISTIEHFSLSKRLLQRLGTAVVRSLSGTDVEDAPSGFRAMTRDCALRLNVFNRFSYTLETIIQVGRSNLRVASVPVRVNPPTRSSRLARSTGHYVARSALAIVGAYLVYRPAKLFGVLAAGFLAPSAVLAVRYLVLMGMGQGKGHVQSVVVGGVLGLCGVFMIAIGVVAHLMGINRRLLEEIRYQQRVAGPGRAEAVTDRAAEIVTRPALALRTADGSAVSTARATR